MQNEKIQKLAHSRERTQNQEENEELSASRSRYQPQNNFGKNYSHDGRSRSTLQKQKKLTTDVSRTSFHKSQASSKSPNKVLIVSQQEIEKKQMKKKIGEQKR